MEVTGYFVGIYEHLSDRKQFRENWLVEAVALALEAEMAINLYGLSKSPGSVDRDMLLEALIRHLREAFDDLQDQVKALKSSVLSSRQPTTRRTRIERRAPQIADSYKSPSTRAG